MKLATILAVTTTLLLPSCVNQSAVRAQRDREWTERQDAWVKKSKENLKAIERAYAPTPRTKEDEAAEELKSAAYYKGLVRSISQMDDGTSDAETIARAAVAENIEALREWKRAQMIHLWRNPHGRDQVESALINMPVRANIDDATSVVLKVRISKRTQSAG